MVGLPSVENREMILKTLLAKEKHENLDFKELATMTEGYTGSDLKVNFGGDLLVLFFWGKSVDVNFQCFSVLLFLLLLSDFFNRKITSWIFLNYNLIDID